MVNRNKYFVLALLVLLSANAKSNNETTLINEQSPALYKITSLKDNYVRFSMIGSKFVFKFDLDRCENPEEVYEVVENAYSEKEEINFNFFDNCYIYGDIYMASAPPNDNWGW